MKVITVKGEGVFVIIDDKKYEAKNGIVEVKLPTKAGSFSITIAQPDENNSDTGDNSAIVLFSSLLALSILVAGVLLIPDIRKKLMK